MGPAESGGGAAFEDLEPGLEVGGERVGYCLFTEPAAVFAALEVAPPIVTIDQVVVYRQLSEKESKVKTQMISTKLRHRPTSH